MKQRSCQCCVLGAGPAGLSAAFELVANGIEDVLIIDRHPIVGGLSRTVEKGGALFDIGPHRFFSRNREIRGLWHELLGDDFLPVNRLTRIYYKKKFFKYPIKPFDSLAKIGPAAALAALVSYIRARLGAKEEPKTFEQWIVQHFGRRLFETFFKTYTEKVWGIACNRIGADWASQRIKGLDLIQVAKSAFRIGGGSQAKTLVEQFDYPRKGAGQMYQALAERVLDAGGDIWLKTRVEKFSVADERIKAVIVRDPDGQQVSIKADHYFNSLPLTFFYQAMDGYVDKTVGKSVEALYYRDHITVDMLVDRQKLFPDQWIYIHSQDVKMARIANYTNFSTHMCGGKPKTPISVEYFVFKDEELFQWPDSDIIELATEEIERLGLLNPQAIEQCWVVKETECYPTYYLGFQPYYQAVCRDIERYANLTQMGRAGMFKYNNQDHSMASGLLAARNYVGAEGSPYDLWQINVDAEYHEAGRR